MYQLTMADGRTEVVDAERVAVPHNDMGLGFARSQPQPMYHFYRGYKLVLSVRDADVTSVREIVTEGEAPRVEG